MQFARSTAIALPLLLGLGAAGPAGAQEMFGGFFSRLLPGSSATPPAAPPPAPVVAAKPAEPPPLPDNPTETNPFNGGRGGFVDAINGHDGGCTGVLCTFVGGEQAPSVAGRGPSQAARTQAELDAIDAAPAPRHVRSADTNTRVEHRCVDTTDPWRCYR